MGRIGSWTINSSESCAIDVAHMAPASYKIEEHSNIKYQLENPYLYLIFMLLYAFLFLSLELGGK